MAMCPLHDSTTTCPHCALFACLPLPPGDSAALAMSAYDLLPRRTLENCAGRRVTALVALDEYGVPCMTEAMVSVRVDYADGGYIVLQGTGDWDAEAEPPLRVWLSVVESLEDQAARAALAADLAEARSLMVAHQPDEGHDGD